MAVERLEGLKLTELNRGETEVLVLARRMIEMGRTIRERILGAKPGETTDYYLFEGGPKVREMILALPFFEFLQIHATFIDDRMVTLGATYHPFGQMFSEYEDVGLGVIKAEHLDMEPGEAAAELIYPTKHIEEGEKWHVLVHLVERTAALSAVNPGAPWGTPER